MSAKNCMVVAYRTFNMPQVFPEAVAGAEVEKVSRKDAQRIATDLVRNKEFHLAEVVEVLIPVT